MKENEMMMKGEDTRAGTRCPGMDSNLKDPSHFAVILQHIFYIRLWRAQCVRRAIEMCQSSFVGARGMLYGARRCERVDSHVGGFRKRTLKNGMSKAHNRRP